MNYRVISYVLGWVANIEAFCLLLPTLWALFQGEETVGAFLVCIFVCLVVGLPLSVYGRKSKDMFAKEGFVAVALSWILMSLLGALPFLLSGSIPSFVDAFFETASGFTTTGASVLSDVEALSESVLLWRSFTHWIGGMGVIVFLVALLPSSGSSFHMVKAESPGYSVSKFVPKIKTTAKILYTIYICMTALEIILLLCGGMSWFESLTFSFGTAGTGGFSVKNSGLADYSSYVQIVITVFMVLFGIDFSFYYLILIRKVKNAFKMEEVIVYLSLFALSVVLIFFNIREMYASTGTAIKDCAFHVASIITTTGYSSTDFNLWPTFSKTILVLLMFSGACAGSTAGGIKVSRIMILFKSIIKEVRVLTHPKSTIKVKMNGKILEHEKLRGVTVFFIAYMLIFALAFLLISLDNLDMTTNFTAVVATLSNIGPGLEMVGPCGNFSVFSDFSTLVLSFVMIIGRLEIFPVLVLLTARTWKNK
ncbi:MAG: TrkH family potassium uptake protein [Clostridia bacterium]|nr:TrkH family potassium uptake protein [Clostridia bacterium]